MSGINLASNLFSLSDLFLCAPRQSIDLAELTDQVPFSTHPLPMELSGQADVLYSSDLLRAPRRSSDRAELTLKRLIRMRPSPILGLSGTNLSDLFVCAPRQSFN